MHLKFKIKKISSLVFLEILKKTLFGIQEPQWNTKPQNLNILLIFLKIQHSDKLNFYALYHTIKHILVKYFIVSLVFLRLQFYINPTLHK